MKKPISLLLCAAMAAANISCSKSYLDTIREPESLFYRGKFREAAKALRPLSKKRGRDQLLYMMECGYIHHAAGNYGASNEVLLPASDLARIVPVSIAKEAASLLTSDTVTNYRGEDFEKVLLRMYLGINFLMLGGYDDARVEFKAVNNELARIKSESGEARYRQNVMAKYLTALVYEITGDMYGDPEDLEFAYIECRQILDLRPDSVLVKRDLARLAAKLDYRDDYEKWVADFSLAENPSDADRGEAVFLLQTGRCAVKKSRGKLLDDRTMKGALAVSIATANPVAGVTVGAVMATLGSAENPVPVFERRPGRVDHVVIDVSGKKIKAELLEDISATAIRNMEDRYPLLAQKVAASVAVKAMMSVAAGIAAKQITEGAGGKSALGAILGAIAGIGTGAALFSQMRPDLRCWHTLPDKLYLARIDLPPGKHQAVLEYVDSSGKCIDKKTLELNVEKGKKVFINERCFI